MPLNQSPIFNTALRYVLQNEGCMDCNGGPIYKNLITEIDGDLGGLTCWGATHNQWMMFFGRPVDREELSAVDYATVLSLYFRFYWMPMDLGSITNQGVATALLDLSVNPGQGFAARAAQRCAGADVDGVMGPKTVAAINSSNPVEYIRALTLEAKNYYANEVKRRPDQGKFLNGWNSRADRLLTIQV